jgi:hypothetical protein
MPPRFAPFNFDGAARKIPAPTMKMYGWPGFQVMVIHICVLKRFSRGNRRRTRAGPYPAAAADVGRLAAEDAAARRRLPRRQVLLRKN